MAGNFTIIPSSEVVAVGQRAVFRCRNPTAISILWIVNDSIVGRNPPPEIIPDTTGGGDNLVDILTIMACLEFNQTKVVCEARFEDVTTQSERSPPVYLLIQGEPVFLLVYAWVLLHLPFKGYKHLCFYIFL